MAQSVAYSQASYEVARPQASDAVGGALRQAYGKCELTDDIARLLSQLDDIDVAPGQRSLRK